MTQLLEIDLAVQTTVHDCKWKVHQHGGERVQDCRRQSDAEQIIAPRNRRLGKREEGKDQNVIEQGCGKHHRRGCDQITVKKCALSPADEQANEGECESVDAEGQSRSQVENETNDKAPLRGLSERSDQSPRDDDNQREIDLESEKRQ